MTQKIYLDEKQQIELTENLKTERDAKIWRRLKCIDMKQKGFKHYLDWYYTKWDGNPPKEKIIEGKIKEFQDRIVKSGFWWLENTGKKEK